MQFKPCPEQPLSEEAKGDDTVNDKNSTPATTTNSNSSDSVQVVVGLSVIVSMLLMI